MHALVCIIPLTVCSVNRLTYIKTLEDRVNLSAKENNLSTLLCQNYSPSTLVICVILCLFPNGNMLHGSINGQLRLGYSGVARGRQHREQHCMGTPPPVTNPPVAAPKGLLKLPDAIAKMENTLQC